MSFRKVSAEVQKKAVEELNENPSLVQEDINHIREWISKQPHLNARTDDQAILNFLRGAKFSLEKTKVKLDTYYTTRSLIPEFFDNRDPLLPELQAILIAKAIAIIRDESKPTLPALLFLRRDKIDLDRTLVCNVIKVILMLADVIINESDVLIINGVYIFDDLTNFTLSYALQRTTTLFKKSLMTYFAYPIRVRGMHIINSPYYMQTIYLLGKSLVAEKLWRRFHVHGDNYLEDIKKNIPLSLIPNEYGGTAGPADELADKTRTKLESYRGRLWKIANIVWMKLSYQRICQPPQNCLVWRGVFENWRLISQTGFVNICIKVDQ